MSEADELFRQGTRGAIGLLSLLVCRLAVTTGFDFLIVLAVLLVLIATFG